MEVQIDNVGIELVCREYQPKTTVRTFKAKCGSYIRFTLCDRRIMKIETERMDCKQPCEACTAQIDSAKKLLKSGK